MRKFIIIALFLVIASNIGSAQDLIVTVRGDSINCRINKIADDFIYFTFKLKDQYLESLIAVSEVKEMKRGASTVIDVPPEILPKTSARSKGGLRASFYGGWAYRTAKISSDYSDEVKDFIEDLKSGMSIGGEAHYFFTDMLGIGVTGSYFFSQNEISSIDYTETIGISYIGPSVQVRMSTSNKNLHWLSSISLGSMNYLDKASTIDEVVEITSGTMGLQYGLGIETRISENIDLILKVNCFQGVLTEYTATYNGESEDFKLDEDEYESLNRIDVSIGLSFGK